MSKKESAGHSVRRHRNEKAAMRKSELQELIVSILTDKGELYGEPLMGAIAEMRDTKDHISYGAMYATLESLENSGVITSRQGEATPERGGKRKRYFRIAEKQ